MVLNPPLLLITNTEYSLPATERKENLYIGFRRIGIYMLNLKYLIPWNIKIMMKFILSTFILLCLLPFQAATASEIEAQELCVQQTVDACMKQCEKSNDIACPEACQSNAQNQCIQAGE